MLISPMGKTRTAFFFSNGNFRNVSGDGPASGIGLKRIFSVFHFIFTRFHRTPYFGLCLSVFLISSISVYLSVGRPVCQSINLSMTLCLSINLSMTLCLSINLPCNLSTYRIKLTIFFLSHLTLGYSFIHFSFLPFIVFSPLFPFSFPPLFLFFFSFFDDSEARE